mmetsp:Transcript_5249/g.7443  ORF Transcript_5249/g.7443 Transcript_5249/m.7443 type:complete len:364 (-) Transcript_5249:345-1436(-)
MRRLLSFCCPFGRVVVDVSDDVGGDLQRGHRDDERCHQHASQHQQAPQQAQHPPAALARVVAAAQQLGHLLLRVLLHGSLQLRVGVDGRQEAVHRLLLLLEAHLLHEQHHSQQAKQEEQHSCVSAARTGRRRLVRGPVLRAQGVQVGHCGHTGIRQRVQALVHAHVALRSEAEGPREEGVRRKLVAVTAIRSLRWLLPGVLLLLAVLVAVSVLTVTVAVSVVVVAAPAPTISVVVALLATIFLVLVSSVVIPPGPMGHDSVCCYGSSGRLGRRREGQRQPDRETAHWGSRSAIHRDRLRRFGLRLVGVDESSAAGLLGDHHVRRDDWDVFFADGSLSNGMHGFWLHVEKRSKLLDDSSTGSGG